MKRLHKLLLFSLLFFVGCDKSDIQFSFNDRFYDYQWYFSGVKNNTDIYFDLNISNDANINFTRFEYSGVGANIGFIDYGFDLSHEDLMAFNYDLLQLNENAIYYNHGTSTLGLLASQRNNEVGIVGISSDAYFLLCEHKNENKKNIINEIKLLVNNGADVINVSLEIRKTLITYSQEVQKILRSGRDGKGTLLVVSAGNDGKRGAKVNIDNVIMVGSIDVDNKITKFSNRNADIFTIGKVVTTLDASAELGRYSTNYVYQSGTSFSAPFVTGLVSLLLEINEDLSARDIKKIIIDSSTLSYDGYRTIDYNNAIEYAENY